MGWLVAKVTDYIPLVVSSLFLSFDPAVSVLYRVWPILFWVSTFLFLFPVLPSRFIASSRFKVLMGLVLSVSPRASQRGARLMLSALFVMLLSFNLLGLVPWTVSVSGHLVMVAPLAVVFWLAGVLSSFSWSKIFNFVGGGLPLVLGAFVALAEFVSLMLRPVVLAFRLSANIVIGHVILLLAGKLFLVSFVGWVLLPVVYLFEIFVCCVQAYIFVLLLSVYWSE